MTRQSLWAVVKTDPPSHILGMAAGSSYPQFQPGLHGSSALSCSAYLDKVIILYIF